MTAHRAWRAASEDLADARELAVDNADFATELPGLADAEAAAADRLREVLVPRDPDDARDVIIEVKAGEGGEESALFASDLARMYARKSFMSKSTRKKPKKCAKAERNEATAIR